MAEVIFRLDDVQDGWLVNTQRALFDFFANNALGPQALVLGVIGNSMRGSTEFSQTLYNYLCINNKFEIACHGFNHNDFSLMTDSEQENEFLMFSAMAREFFPELEVNTFIPPYNRINSCTINVAVRHGFSVLSGLDSIYTKSNFFNNPSFMNCTVSTSTSFDENSSMCCFEEIFSVIQSQFLSKFDWCVVMLHPQEFSQGLTDEVNNSSLQTMQKVIEWCIENGHEITTFSEMRRKLKNADYVTEYLSSVY